VIGIAFLCFAYIGLFLMFASLRLNMTLVLMMLFLWLSFLLIGIGNLVEASGLVILGGWSGIISALFAFYAATAMVMNSVSERVVLGLGTFGEGGAASHHVA
jgi:succinate-acetate transporter protein